MAAAGLLTRRPIAYRLQIVLTVTAYGAAWAALVAVGDRWAALGLAVLVGLIATQLGFVGHDAGHAQVCRTRRGNRVVGLLVGDALIGLSFGWWVPKHSSHHAHPNEVGVDPDVGPGVPSGATPPVPAGRSGSIARWFGTCTYRWQAELFLPMMALRTAGMHVLGVRQLMRRHDRRTAVEATLLCLHWATMLVVLLTVLSPLRAALFLVVEQTVLSVSLGVAFAPNHKAMPLVAPGTAMGFARRQVVTARNIRGGWWTSFALGGLDRQIEHHLFPSMPRPNLRHAQPMVRAYCERTGLPYGESGFVASWGDILRHLAATGRTARRHREPAVGL